MQPTTLGPNMTGATLAPAALAAMTQATEELTPCQEIDTSTFTAGEAQIGREAEINMIAATGLNETGLCQRRETTLKVAEAVVGVEVEDGEAGNCAGDDAQTFKLAV